MKINIKPKILTASDYHDFAEITDNAERIGEFKIDYFEIEPARISREEYYRAIVWPEGAEEELFEFIFTNELAWEALTYEE